jgi:hypothetical protein
MSERPLTFDQIQNMRAAIDMVLRSLGEHAKPRAEVVSVIVPLVESHGHSASALALLALEKMGLSHFDLDNGEQTAG